MDFLDAGDFDADLMLDLLDREVAEIQLDLEIYNELEEKLKILDTQEEQVLKLIRKGTPEALKEAQEIVKNLA